MTIYVVRRTVRRVSEAITTHFRNSRCSCVTLCLRSAQNVRYLDHNRRGRIVTNAATTVYPHAESLPLDLAFSGNKPQTPDPSCKLTSATMKTKVCK